MKWLRVLMVAATVASPGCVVEHPGSQTLVINPFGDRGLIQEADAQSNRFWREASGNRHWGEGERHWTLTSP